MLRLACVLAVLLGGCDIYWDSPHKPPPICNGPNAEGFSLRDPETGQCQTFTEPGCDCLEGCDTGEVLPGWGFCQGACDSLDESQCLATAGCHATYTEGSDAADGGDGLQEFLGCWELAPGGPTGGVTCGGLAADACTQRDDCVGLYASAPSDGHTEFDRCADEPDGLCSSDSDCIGGQYCDTSSCYSGPCSDCPSCGACPCLGKCTEGLPPPPPPPPAPCSTLTTEAACTARTDCEALYTGYDCTCDLSGCTCQTETFASCEPH